uniref:2S seed storage protein-like n=1 Tax=Erigeron canadensis TaxID=72917 RepID=UPI001CB92F02|nr:2S seed storage protein-like [Erigeron canadensis]
MAKLVVFELVFVALVVAFASAQKTIIPLSSTRENTLARTCGERIRGRNFNFCHSYVARALPQKGPPVPGQKERLQELQKQCCKQVKEFTQECQCDAVKELYLQVKLQGGQPMEQVRQIVQKLPDTCKLQITQCQIPSRV